MDSSSPLGNEANESTSASSFSGPPSDPDEDSGCSSSPSSSCSPASSEDDEEDSSEDEEDSEEEPPGPPSRTEQRAAWSGHLQLLHAPLKCPGRWRHLRNGFRPGSSSNCEQLVQAPELGTYPREWIKMAAMYDCRIE